MKIYCEECNGSGKLVELLRYREVCDKCDGKGYTENDELERLADVGKTLETLAEYSRINLEAFIEDDGEPTKWELEYFNSAYDDDVILASDDLLEVLKGALDNVIYNKNL